jgi:hypothetical protein
MEDIIEPVNRELLLKELTPEKFVRKTNNGQNLIYIITHHDSPNLMREIGRVRELAFRTAGGGTGMSIDIDEYDTQETPYKQLIVWNDEDQEIVGGYRFIRCDDALKSAGEHGLATSHLFEFNDLFKKKYIPNTIELGRSFVQPKYQPGVDNRKGLFSLDNLWDGLGALVVDNPDIRYFFGKVTMYTDFNQQARDLILSFMHFYFPDPEKLVVAHKGITIATDTSEFIKSLEGLSYKDGHKILNQKVRELGENIPPLVNAYMNLSSTMKSFGTAINDEFGDVEETGILVTIDDIYPSKKERHISTYISEKENS